MSAKEKFMEAKKKMAEARKEAESILKEVFLESLKDLFESNKKLQHFRFHAYTPYFNDGDECTYGVYCDEPVIILDGEEDDGDSYGYYPDNKEKNDLQNEIARTLYQFDHEDYKTMFGDHVSIQVNRDGTINTEDYEHD
jgi:hypothetical protein